MEDFCKSWLDLNRAEEYDIIKKAKEKDAEAIEIVLLGLKNFIEKYVYNKIGIYNIAEDLIQEGNIGVLKAIEKFDFSNDVKFISYASYYIKQNILRYLYNNKELIRIPTDKIKKYYKIKNIFKYEENSENLFNVLESVNLSYKDYCKIYNIRHALSLGYEMKSTKNNNESISLLDIISNEEDVESLAAFNYKQDNNKISLLLFEGLTERERIVLANRYGFITFKGMTLEQIGRKFGVTRERVRQIENKALKKIRKNCISNNIELDELNNIPLDLFYSC